MSKLNQFTLLLSILIPIIILTLGLELSELTIILWPMMVGLIALGGKISGISDYIYIGFMILLNVPMYLLMVNLLRVIYQKTRHSVQ